MNKILENYLPTDLVNIVGDYNTIKKWRVRWFKQMVDEELELNIKFRNEHIQILNNHITNGCNIKNDESHSHNIPSLIVAVKDRIYTSGLEVDEDGEWGSNTIEFTRKGRQIHYLMTNP
jgi:hypothetical protein